jgi:hypothetical protein
MGTTPDQGKGICTSVRVRPDQSIIMGDDLKLSINLPALSSERDATPGYVILGEDIETGKRVYIGDIERRSGLYILGKPGVGKTTLIVKLMDQDIRNGHGVFFLDPHDGIDRLRSACDSLRLLTDLVELNLKDEVYSLGINLLACKDIDSWAERNNTYDRARWVFFKLFEKEFGDRP